MYLLKFIHFQGVLNSMEWNLNNISKKAHMKMTATWMICALGVIILSSCGEKKSETTATSGKGVMTFYYYPKTNVYYDVSNSSYFYSIDSGRNWTVLKDSVGQKTRILGKQVIIKSSTNDIWRDNELHRKMYGGVLINLTSNRDSARNKNGALKGKLSLKKKKLLTPADSILIPDDHPKRRNFFQRLFGKKRKRKVEPDSII